MFSTFLIPLKYQNSGIFWSHFLYLVFIRLIYAIDWFKIYEIPKYKLHCILLYVSKTKIRLLSSERHFYDILHIVWNALTRHLMIFYQIFWDIYCDNLWEMIQAKRVGDHTISKRRSIVNRHYKFYYTFYCIYSKISNMLV